MIGVDVDISALALGATAAVCGLSQGVRPENGQVTAEVEHTDHRRLSLTLDQQVNTGGDLNELRSAYSCDLAQLAVLMQANTMPFRM
jgi:hypothetical protein